jgi:hypothetical protein
MRRRVQIPPSRRFFEQNVKRDSGIGDPRQPGVPQIVPSEIAVAEGSDNFVQTGGVAQDCRGDPVAAGSGE